MIENKSGEIDEKFAPKIEEPDSMVTVSLLEHENMDQTWLTITDLSMIN